MKRINIAHLTCSLGDGGTENGIVNIVNGLSSEKYFHLICSLTKERQFEERIKVPNYAIVGLDKKEGNDLTIPFKLRRVFMEYKINIAHLRGWPTLIEGIIGSKLANVRRIIYGFHGKSHDELNSYKRRRHYAEKFAMNFVDQIVTLAEPMRDDLCSRLGINSNKVKIIYNGVNVDQFNQGVAREEIRNKLQIEEDDFVIGSVGRLDPVKDYKTLIQAFALFANKFSNSKLILVGDGPVRSELEKAALATNAAGKIIFTGYKNNVHKFLQVMDVYVQSSLYEGFSNTIVEAMAVGLPVIATDVGGNGVLISDGINGFLTGTNQPGDICSKLLLLANDMSMKRKMSETNRQVAREKYSLEKMISAYDDCYDNIFSSI